MPGGVWYFYWSLERAHFNPYLKRVRKCISQSWISNSNTVVLRGPGLRGSIVIDSSRIMNARAFPENETNGQKTGSSEGNFGLIWCIDKCLSGGVALIQTENFSLITNSSRYYPNYGTGVYGSRLFSCNELSTRNFSFLHDKARNRALTETYGSSDTGFYPGDYYEE